MSERPRHPGVLEGVDVKKLVSDASPPSVTSSFTNNEKGMEDGDDGGGSPCDLLASSPTISHDTLVRQFLDGLTIIFPKIRVELFLFW